MEISDSTLNLPYAKALVDLRSKISSRDNVGVYAIFDNEQLVKLCGACPRTIKDLAKISGFPANGARVARWGEEILSVFDTNVSSDTKSQAFG